MNSSALTITTENKYSTFSSSVETTLPMEIMPDTYSGSATRITRELPGSLTTQAGENYRLEEKIGEGGLGIIYRSVRESDGRLVAVKLPAVDDYVSRNSLLREGQLLALMSHRHIVTLLDHGQSIDGEPFIVLEHLDGQTLEQLLCDHGALPLAEAARICLQIAEALNYAHSLGIVHCDLKPANVFLDEKLNVKVLDFGISARVNDPERTHKYGSLLYMSPEQINDERPSVQSDIYQLALVFFRSYFDRLPFDCSSMKTILKYRHHPVTVSWSGQKSSKELRRLLKKAMSQDPCQRPSSMHDFMQALRTAAFSTDSCAG
jgi:eukaryotic-like serine/threonine-protein kinase